ncbi:LPS-assembly protein LptD [Futiania mangrovi]|uniref:LPS-assembly protein LptD n=1 Tax=Futiania mangrovi TaxID=2959716 RepID=A0A9J6PD91_9PROT|nr:LPS assembly protein LptD [Futiania mangrovii]MCP1335651.1 LPS assembly protein LptD [Futiania mangrovii]
MSVWQGREIRRHGRPRPGVAAFVLAAAVMAAVPPSVTLAQDPPAGPLPQYGDLIEGGGEGLLIADELIYDREARTVTASGGVEIFYRGRRLYAERLTYNEATGAVDAHGNVTLVDEAGNAVYATGLSIDGDLRDGIAEGVAARIGPQAKVAGARMKRTEGRLTVIERAVYSPCNVCEENPTPFWQIKARTVTHDLERKVIAYEDPQLEIMGTPVAWLPYFEHPDPSVKRQSGFLLPSFFSSSSLGYGASVPYHLVLAPNRDVTLTPQFLSDEWPVLGVEYRERTQTGQFRLEGTGTIADIEDGLGNTTSSDAFRGALFGDGRFALGDTATWGFDLELTTDDTFLRRYRISSDDRLASRLFAERFGDREFWSASALYFQGLRQTDKPGLTPIVLPFLEYANALDGRVLGGEITVEASALALTRTDGSDTYRLSGTVGWERRFLIDNGLVFTGFGSLRTDLYQVMEGADPLNPATDLATDTTFRVVPTVGAEVSWPLFRPGGRVDQVLEPIVQLVVSPYGTDDPGIPNEDSASFEFDETNLFAKDRFPGIDSVEPGPRINVGVRYTAFAGNIGSAEVTFGQSFRLKDAMVFTAASGLRDQSSDYVGRIALNWQDNFSLVHRFRLNRDDLSYERAEVGIRGGPDWWRSSATYVKLTGDPAVAGLTAREEFNLGTDLQIDNNWAVRGGWRRDLDASRSVEAGAGLFYADECLEVELSVRRRFTRDRDIEPSTSLNLRINLLTLG